MRFVKRLSGGACTLNRTALDKRVILMEVAMQPRACLGCRIQQAFLYFAPYVKFSQSRRWSWSALRALQCCPYIGAKDRTCYLLWDGVLPSFHPSIHSSIHPSIHPRVHATQFIHSFTHSFSSMNKTLTYSLIHSRT